MGCYGSGNPPREKRHSTPLGNFTSDIHLLTQVLETMPGMLCYVAKAPNDLGRWPIRWSAQSGWRTKAVRSANCTGD